MRKGFIYVLLTSVLFATLEPVSKLIANDIHPLLMTVIRFSLGGLILLPFSIKAAAKHALTRKNCLSMALLGILCVCVSMPLLQYGVLLGDSPALIAIIFSSNSVFTVMLAVIFLGERISAGTVLSTALCIAGILVCMDFNAGTNITSALLAVAAAFTFSLYTVLGRKLALKFSGVIQTGFSFCIGSAVLIAVILLSGTEVNAQINSKSAAVLLYLGAAVTGLGYWLYFRAMEKASALAASLVFFIKPVLTPMFAFFITGAPITVQTLAALVLVVGGAVVGSGYKLKRP